MPEVVIAGAGLAGTFLAWHCHWRGLDYRLVDPRERETASRVAAGILNPLAGRNLAPVRGGKATLEVARVFYEKISKSLEEKLFHAIPIRRILFEEAMRRRFRSRYEADVYEGLARVADAQDLDPEIRAPDILACLEGGGRVDTERLLDASWDYFAALGRTEEGRVDPGAVGSGKEATVFCLGEAEVREGRFGGEGFRPAKGEILDLEIEGDLREAMVVGRKWLLPVGAGRWRAGATYDRENLDGLPTAAARAEIEAHLAEFLRAPYEVVGHRAAVRPVYRRGLPVIKEHADARGVYLFNGLGSKGCVHGPAAAQALAAHLADGTPLPSDPNLDPADA